jgi:hypothetical protein
VSGAPCRPPQGDNIPVPPSGGTVWEGECKMKKMLHRIACTLIIASTFCFSQKTADFLILDHPQKYAIFDQYQQPVPQSGRDAFVPGIPLQIISSDDMLGDQITHALRGAFDGKTWYLQKDDAGNLAGADAGESRHIYKGCEIGSDTVEITKEKAIAFSEIGKDRIFLNRQEKVIRIFRSKDQWYLRRRSGGTVRYGWSSFSNSGAWRRVVAAVAAVDTGISDYLQDRLIERFRIANAAYQQYFGHFNTVTGKDKTVPAWRWELRPQAREVHFFLNDPYRTGSGLDESTRYLVRDLENMLIGRQYDVVCDKGDIMVRPKDRDAATP